ncbi:MAG TPA: hypothetical protein VF209_01890 [Patescibacteria group bacterium]
MQIEALTFKAPESARLQKLALSEVTRQYLHLCVHHAGQTNILDRSIENLLANQGSATKALDTIMVERAELLRQLGTQDVVKAAKKLGFGNAVRSTPGVDDSSQIEHTRHITTEYIKNTKGYSLLIKGLKVKPDTSYKLICEAPIYPDITSNSASNVKEFQSYPYLSSPNGDLELQVFLNQRYPEKRTMFRDGKIYVKVIEINTGSTIYRTEMSVPYIAQPKKRTKFPTAKDETREIKIDPRETDEATPYDPTLLKTVVDSD